MPIYPAASTATTPPVSATVATSETTASTSYVDLATPGPAVTVTAGASGYILVTTFATLDQSAATGYALASVAGVGAGAGIDIAASDEWSLVKINTDFESRGGTFLLGPFTPGNAVTLTMKYRADTTGTATFTRRFISAQAI
jgi:hypothetical protein